MEFLPAGQVQLKGRMGSAIKLSIANRLKKIDYTHLVDPFRMRDETDGRWRCEFWGKIVRSAIRSWRATLDDELLSLIRETVADICSTQTENGCISSYPEDLQTNDWDIWGRKYVILGLARYYNEIEQDPKVKDVLIKMTDHLITQVGPNAKKIGECGHHDGQPAASILGAIIKVYRISKLPRFLDYAKWIVKKGGCGVFDCLLQHKNPHEILNGKAYEMTSCAEGLLELYREIENEEYLNAVIDYFYKVLNQELFITGVGGLKDIWGEFWDEGNVKQTQSDVGALGETCVTTTFIRFALNLMRSVQDSKLADAIEISLFNGILGAMTPDGSWWVHANPTPLTSGGYKQRAGDQIPGYGEDCCLAQGPEALACAAMYAVMRDEDGLIVNHYEDSAIQTKINNANVKLDIQGDYPHSGDIKIKLNLDQSVHFDLKLRIPQWSTATTIKVNGNDYPAGPETYLSIDREWNNEDTIEIEFDISPRVIQAKDGSNHVAILRGPIVMSRDSRLGNIDIPFNCNDKLVLNPVQADFKLHECYELNDGSLICDYSSAANEFNENNKLCIWMKRIVAHDFS